MKNNIYYTKKTLNNPDLKNDYLSILIIKFIIKVAKFEHEKESFKNCNNNKKVWNFVKSKIGKIY